MTQNLYIYIQQQCARHSILTQNRARSHLRLRLQKKNVLTCTFSATIAIILSLSLSPPRSIAYNIGQSSTNLSSDKLSLCLSLFYNATAKLLWIVPKLVHSVFLGKRNTYTYSNGRAPALVTREYKKKRRRRLRATIYTRADSRVSIYLREGERESYSRKIARLGAVCEGELSCPEISAFWLCPLCRCSRTWNFLAFALPIYVIAICYTRIRPGRNLLIRFSEVCAQRRVIACAFIFYAGRSYI